LFEALVRHASRRPLSLHVPGHRGGNHFDAEGRRFFAPLLPIDLTELSGLDDLYQPQGPIAEAQALAAAAFGAEETVFLVNGSTAGNLAMVLSVCRPGDILLVGRDAHRSVFHACMLAGVRAVLLPTRVHPQFAVSCGVDPETVRQGLARYPEARAVFLTNPNYYGMGRSLAAIAETVHAYGIPLLVDEAHGAHFAFHSALPPTALSAGADAVVQSAHKTLPALTMGAFLHLQGRRISRWKVRQTLAMIQTSSPSYPVMASLDLARRWMAAEGRQRLGWLIEEAHRFRVWLRQEGWTVPPPSDVFYEWTDPLRLLLHHPDVPGLAVARRLEAADVFPELADPLQVVCVVTAANRRDDLARLKPLLSAIRRRPPQASPPQELKERLANGWQAVYQDSGWTAVAFDPGWMYGEPETVPWTAALGRRSAGMVVPYPPGIPLLLPGERIRQSHMTLLEVYQQMEAHVQGLWAGKLAVMPETSTDESG
jgi:arginine/lysine/ornithine decarboxylase